MKTTPRTIVGQFGAQGGTRTITEPAVGGRGADLPDRGSPLRMLLILAAVFVLPVVVGFGLFWSGWRPAVLRNHGELIQPPRALPSGEGLHGKWLLIVPARDGCAQSCQDALQRLQQAQAALGKDQGRVQRVVVGTAPIPPLQGVTVISPSADETAWRSALDDFAPAAFVADPFGNVVMRYGQPIDARHVLRDMERLLKYSWVR